MAEEGENWRLEATAVINDVKKHVEYIQLSEILQCTNRNIYMNLRTKENKDYCIELSGMGFRIAGNKFDEIDGTNEEWFETPYSLLNNISPLFRQSFGESLFEKLTELNETSL